MQIWADAVVFIGIFKFGVAILATKTEKYFIVMSDKIQVYKRVLFFFAIPIGTINVTQLVFHMGHSKFNDRSLLKSQQP